MQHYVINIICVEHHYAQTNTNNVKKTTYIHLPSFFFFFFTDLTLGCRPYMETAPHLSHLINWQKHTDSGEVCYV